MKIYTSYWAMVKYFPKNLVGLNTTVWPPRWRPLGRDKNNVWVIDCPPLKPGAECEGLCNGSCNPPHPEDCKFLQTYRKQLEALDINEFLNHLDNLSMSMAEGEGLKDIDFALIVFEAPSRACSERWMLQEWLRAHDIEIEEWNKNVI